jgi:hypothetical protein
MYVLVVSHMVEGPFCAGCVHASVRRRTHGADGTVLPDSFPENDRMFALSALLLSPVNHAGKREKCRMAAQYNERMRQSAVRIAANEHGAALK